MVIRTKDGKFSKSTAVSILKQLERNGFDIKYTSKQFGVDTNTIDILISKYGSDVFNSEDVKDISKKYDEVLEDLDKEFFEKASSVRNMIIDAIERNIDKCNNISQLAQALQIVNEVIKTNRNIGQGNNINVTFLQRIEQINNVISQRTNNKKIKDILYEDIGTTGSEE